MVLLTVIHTNTESQEFDLGDNDKIEWIIVGERHSGKMQKFFAERTPEELKAILQREHDESIRLRKISYANAEKIIEKCEVEELKNLLNDIWDGNATKWLDNPSNHGTIGQETILETGFTSNQMRWIEHMFHILQGDE